MATTIVSQSVRSSAYSAACSRYTTSVCLRDHHRPDSRGIGERRSPMAQALADSSTGESGQQETISRHQHFLLAFAGYGSQYWLTYRQAQALGGNVRKGQHGTQDRVLEFAQRTKRRSSTAKSEERSRLSSAATPYLTWSKRKG